MAYTIRQANPEEAATLSTIARQAKAYWGYAPEQLEVWGREFLTISSAYIREHHVWVACLHADAVGFSGVRLHDTEAELDRLWIQPACIGRGLGQQLLIYTAARVREMGYPQLVFTSDPHADGFYRKLGAEKIGEYYSVQQHTMLTKFVFPAVPRAKPSA